MPTGIITANEQWMNTYLNEYNSLSDQLKSHLHDFLILWSFFEFQVLESGADASKIKSSILSNPNKFENLDKYKNTLFFVQNRYLYENEYNQIFDRLNFRRNDKEEYVKTTLLDEDVTLNTIASLLIIIYRLRNNLFHGLKWIYGFTDQDELFEHANIILSYAIEDMNN